MDENQGQGAALDTFVVAAAHALRDRGLDVNKVTAWLDENYDELWETTFGPMLDRLQVGFVQSQQP